MKDAIRKKKIKDKFFEKLKLLFSVFDFIGFLFDEFKEFFESRKQMLKLAGAYCLNYKGVKAKEILQVGKVNVFQMNLFESVF